MLSSNCLQRHNFIIMAVVMITNAERVYFRNNFTHQSMVTVGLTSIHGCIGSLCKKKLNTDAKMHHNDITT